MFLSHGFLLTYAGLPAWNRLTYLRQRLAKKWREATLLSSPLQVMVGRVARLSRNVGQPDHILANPIISHKA